MAQQYEELMALGKEAAFRSDLKSAIRYLRMAQEIENTSKVRKRIKKIQSAMDDSDEDSSEDDKENHHPNRQRSKSDHNDNQQTTKQNPDNSGFAVS